MEGNSGELETIDVVELMKDLDDDDDDNEKSPRTKQFSKAPLPRPKMPSAMTASAKLPLDFFTLEPSDLAEFPSWQASLSSGLGRSPTNPADSALLTKDASTYGTARSRGGSVGGSSLHTPELFGDKLSVLPPQDTLTEHLQRCLSFEASPKKEMDSIFRQTDSFDARHGKGLTMADSSSVAASWLLNENDSALSFSSPPFSSAVNLKRWFRDDSRTLKRQQGSKLMPKTSSSEAQLPPQKVSPASSHPTVKMMGPSMHISGDASKIAQGGAARRHRHSFTSMNRDQQFTEDKSYLFVNRPSSWELEKVVVDPKLKVVFYSTSAQADVHAYEDSNAVRAILISLVGASFDEKSVSQHPEYEQELRSALNTPTALVPTVYVRGRFIAGVDNIMNLYKKGVLGSLLSETLAHGLKPNAPCICRGGKFLVCPVCKGKRRLARQGEDSVLCRHCSGTGLIKCPTCLSA